MLYGRSLVLIHRITDNVYPLINIYLCSFLLASGDHHFKERKKEIRKGRERKGREGGREEEKNEKKTSIEIMIFFYHPQVLAYSPISLPFSVRTHIIEINYLGSKLIL